MIDRRRLTAFRPLGNEGRKNSKHNNAFHRMGKMIQGNSDLSGNGRARTVPAATNVLHATYDHSERARLREVLPKAKVASRAVSRPVYLRKGLTRAAEDLSAWNR